MKPNTTAKTDRLRVSVGASRFSKRWQRESLTWQELVARLTTAKTASVTLAEALKLPKAKQDGIKDQGGYVGGVLNGEHRKKTNVVARSLITLDADDAMPTFPEVVAKTLHCTALLHSTFKHTEERPRYRLIIPTDREMTIDEYNFISRRIAADIGNMYFDSTTHDPARLMYWPVIPRGGKLVWRLYEGDMLAVDDYLEAHPQWQDVTQWEGMMDSDRLARPSRAADPLEKPGWIGAFCRAYTVPEAIEVFLSDFYEEGEQGRYTYKGSEATNGAVVYEDKWLYSFHSHDPAQGKLLNAFDLVRIHLFGDEDDDVDTEKVPIHQRPSYASMMKLVQADEAAQTIYHDERAALMQSDFNEFGEPSGTSCHAKPMAEVRASLAQHPKTGRPLKLIENARRVIYGDEALAGKLAYNEFTRRMEVVGDLPWRKKSTDDGWTDADDAQLRYYMERTYGLTDMKSKIDDAFATLRHERAYHPIRTFFDTVEWDGIPRMETLFIDMLGAEDTAYVRTVTRKMILAGVARIYEPGCKMDNMLVLVGPQGVGKSYILKQLGGQWFSDSVLSMAGKESFEQLQGKHVLEFGELAAMRKMEIEQIKNYISKQVDTYRPAYGKRSEDAPRQCIFFGTTNNPYFLKDVTGNRRFWPVTVTDKEECRKRLFGYDMKAYMAQVWAEAVYYWTEGERDLHLSRDDEQLARAEQEAHRVVNEKAGIVEAYLDTLLPENWAKMDKVARSLYFDDPNQEGTVRRDRVCVAEILAECLGIDPNRADPRLQNEVHDIMASMPGWERYGGNKTGRLWFGAYGSQRAYVRKESE